MEANQNMCFIPVIVFQPIIDQIRHALRPKMMLSKRGVELQFVAQLKLHKNVRGYSSKIRPSS